MEMHEREEIRKGPEGMTQPGVVESAEHPKSEHDGMAEESEGFKRQVGRRILDRRRALDMTAAELGKRAGIARSTISGYEAGNALPGMAEQLKICNVLDITPTFLVYGTDQAGISKSAIAEYLDVDDHEKMASRFLMAALSLEKGDQEAIAYMVARLAEGRIGKTELRKLGAIADLMVDEIRKNPQFNAAIDRVTEVAEANLFEEQAEMKI